MRTPGGPADAAGPGLALWYLYDGPLPNRYAASIQIVRTGAAFAAAPDRFTFLAGPLRADEAAILAHYGVPPRPKLAIRAFFPSRRVPNPLRDWLIRRSLRRLLAEIAATPGRHVLMSRGETGIAILPELHRLVPRGGAVRLVHEMHCLSHLRDAERRSGRSLAAADLPPDALADRARERDAVRLADVIVYLTPEVAAAARDALAPDAPSLILPSGAEPRDRAETAAPPRFDLVYAGKIEARKGVGELAAAMAFLPGRRLGVAGGPAPAARRLRERLEAEGLADRVDFVGLLAPAEVDGFLQSGRVGVCPMTVGVDTVADRFTSPIKLMQMMANGMAIVATDVAPVRAVATHGRDALLVPPGDPAALAAAAERLLGDPALAARLGAAARRTSERYSWEARAAALRAFLRADAAATVADALPLGAE